jgi:hypothetical protein
MQHFSLIFLNKLTNWGQDTFSPIFFNWGQHTQVPFLIGENVSCPQKKFKKGNHFYKFTVYI